LEGWSALFNCGFTLLESTYEKIMLLEKDSLTSFVINISSVIAKDDDFEKNYGEELAQFNERWAKKRR